MSTTPEQITPQEKQSAQPVSQSDKSYTAFWPVFIVFFFFTFTAILQLYYNLKARSNLNASLVQLSKAVDQSKAKGAALNGLAHDLIELAPTSVPAQQIVTDFRIQFKGASPTASAPANQPPAPATAPAASTAPTPAPKQ